GGAAPRRELRHPSIPLRGSGERRRPAARRTRPSGVEQARLTSREGAGMTHIGGEAAPGFEPVLDAFRQVVAEQSGTGAAMAAWYDGRWVARLHGGCADVARSRPWEAESIVMPYSVSKPFAAVCLLMLVDRGLVDLDQRMQTYWPELVAPATVR